MWKVSFKKCFFLCSCGSLIVFIAIGFSQNSSSINNNVPNTQTNNAYRHRNVIAKVSIAEKRKYLRDLMALLGDAYFENLKEDIDILLEDVVKSICSHCTFYSNTSHINMQTKSVEMKFNDTASKPKVSVLNDDKLNETFFTPRVEVINNLSYKFSLMDESYCSIRGGKKPFLLVLIPTVKDNVKDRNAVRETWGSLAYNNSTWGNARMKEIVRLVFILGSSSFNATDVQKLTQEAKQFGDILLADFVDSYKNLSRKIVVGLDWIDTFCPGVNHVLKVDEDTFVHVPKLISILKQVEAEHSSFVLGRRHMFDKPPVVREGRWAVGPEYPLPHFPAYVYGHSYVISGPAIKTILNAFRHMPLVPNEDAFITGILSKAGNITRLASDLFAFEYFHSVICRISYGEYVSVTRCCEHHHRIIYDDLKNGSCDGRIQRDIKAPGCRFNK